MIRLNNKNEMVSTSGNTKTKRNTNLLLSSRKRSPSLAGTFRLVRQGQATHRFLRAEVPSEPATHEPSVEAETGGKREKDIQDVAREWPLERQGVLDHPPAQFLPHLELDFRRGVGEPVGKGLLALGGGEFLLGVVWLGSKQYGERSFWVWVGQGERTCLASSESSCHALPAAMAIGFISATLAGLGCWARKSLKKKA